MRTVDVKARELSKAVTPTDHSQGNPAGVEKWQRGLVAEALWPPTSACGRESPRTLLMGTRLY